jgi:mannosylfructose-phosphate synthase
LTSQVDFETHGTHVLMITNHGVHEWEVVPGLPDTGGQNVYVNQLTEALIAQGYRVTIVNRGGYPHPINGKLQTGVVPHSSGRARILYIEDGKLEFVRKEDMGDRVDALVGDLERQFEEHGDGYDLIISHYWDAGVIGVHLNDRSPRRVPHIWIPHSLGTLKKRNMDPSSWESLRIDARIDAERELIHAVDGTVATSTVIANVLQDDYGRGADHFLPPCIDVGRYHPRPREQCAGVWGFLAAHSRLSAEELSSRRIVTEISRTDRTKRKDVLIRAFARVVREFPDTALVVSLDEKAGVVYDQAMSLVRELDLTDDVMVVGSVWELLPCLYALTDIYCTPSVMEGFGMSAQEAAATSVPVIASDLVPFATDYLLGPDPDERTVENGESEGERGTLLVGEGALVVPADDVAAFAEAMKLLLTDDARRVAMGRKALDITIPYFTWAARTRDMLDDLGLSPSHVER